MTSRYLDRDDFARVVLIAVWLVLLSIFAGIAIIQGIRAFTAPYSGWLILIPLFPLFGAGYGAAYVLDYQPYRRLKIAGVAATAGSLVFIIALRSIIEGDPVLWSPGALLSMLGYFVLFAIIPTVGVCFLVAALCPDLRAMLMGKSETLVDFDQLPPELIAPIVPYLEGTRRQPAWLRFARSRWFHRGTSVPRPFRINQDELKALFAKSSQLVAARAQSYVQEKAAIEAEDARNATQARERFLRSLSPEERSILELRLRASAEADARVPDLERENAGLKQDLENMTKQLASVEGLLKAKKVSISNVIYENARR